MMSISSRADRTRRAVRDALLTAAAMMLSYLEVLLPLDLLIPLPGFKPGFANLVTVAAFVWISKWDAALISGLRIFLMGMLFGNPASFFFSALGGIFAWGALLVSSKCLTRCSFLGISVLSAAAHNLGQLTAAAILFGSTVILSYLPFLLIAALIAGGLTGAVLNLSAGRIGRILCEK